VANLNCLPIFFTRSLGLRDRKRGRSEDGGDSFIFDDPELLALGPKVKLGLNFKMSARDLPRDSEGKVIMPFVAKGATIHSLGTVVYDRPAFQSKNYIWPVGFKSTRKLPSIKHAGEHTTYASEIIDGGTAPLFTITPADDPTLLFKHATSSGVWVEALKLIKKRPNVSVSGPEMYGFSDPSVKMLIQELPDARKCSTYQWKDFDNDDFATPLSAPPDELVSAVNNKNSSNNNSNSSNNNNNNNTNDDAVNGDTEDAQIAAAPKNSANLDVEAEDDSSSSGSQASPNNSRSAIRESSLSNTLEDEEMDAEGDENGWPN